MTDIDCRYTSEIVCPFCGYTFHDSWEFDFDGSEDTTVECGRCEKDFIVYKNVCVTYVSSVKEGVG